MNNVKSAERVLDLLELLSMNQRPMRFNEIAVSLGYPKSSLHGLLATLVNRSYVVRDDGDRYALVDSFRDGFNWIGGFEAVLRRHAIPIMTAARDASGETVFLSIRDANHDARLVHKVVSRQPIRYDSGNEALPGYASVMGRVLLAYASPEEVDAYFERTELRRFTDKTLTEESAIRLVLEDIRQRGYGIIEEEYTIGGCGIAAPVRDRAGRVVAVLDIATVTQRYELRKSEMLACVLAAATELSAKLGYAPDTNIGAKK
ncbi:IclR family transcriptional regulator [Chelativorans sp. AA-79]|uniref:IclR family transcriptional regulator n=1 Tax=Chelativorans sp. AA-79 TaxID=3028735 RepID=UPI0023F779B8|nr:IclR family transcriptional regulator [Chelativorans sp. AA-79]WEX09150.1 IclR family transcriptional regulator [Chelativorans sp. AA-79]